MNMGKVTTEKPLTRSFDVYNDSEKEINFLSTSRSPDHVNVSFQPEILAPKSKGNIMLTYDANGKNDYGYVSDPLTLYTNEDTLSEKKLRIIATIEEYFAPLTQEELEQTRRLTFDETVHDFGRVRKNISVSTEFKFTNTGKSPLNIRTIKPNCGCPLYCK
jgi:hypothetical protein